MPARPLPTLSHAELRKHRTSTSCYVALGGRVYDVTSFLEDHPGGGELILEYGGQEVQEIMGDELSHMHSEAAYEILDELVVGVLDEDDASPASPGNGKLHQRELDIPLQTKLDKLQPISAPSDEQSSDHSVLSEAKLSVETDAVDDYRRHKFLDLDRPLLMQVWNGGFSKEFYLTEVHRPRHYKGGQSAPLFGNFLEPLSKTPWWVVPTLWLPPVVYGTFIAKEGLSGWGQVAFYWLIGLAIWTLVEYGLHRCLFHVDTYGLLVPSVDLKC